MKNMPKFEEFLLNEIYKRKGDATHLTIEERLETSYQIIKEQPKIYKKMNQFNFFQAFIWVNKNIIFKTDKADIIALIDFSYIVLNDKEDIKDDYFEMKRNIEAVRVENKKNKFTNK